MRTVCPPCVPPTPCSAQDLLAFLRHDGVACMTVPAPNGSTAWGLFRNPIRVLTTNHLEEVEPLLSTLESELKQGHCAAGFIAYEAAPAFDPVFEVRSPVNFPLLTFAIYQHPPEALTPPRHDGDSRENRFRAELTETEYARKIDAVRAHIIAGDIYQANLTFRCILDENDVPPEELFLNLLSCHPVPYAAFLNFGEQKIVSISPELFLESNGREIVSAPMKGTARRHPDPRLDRMAAKALAEAAKHRAENLMITDMVRNDLGRICRPGSIAVNPLFHVDTYHTLHQMSSTVRGTLVKSLRLFDILQATFPPASITGAPKIKAMEVIARQEKSPRNIYTGSIGCFFPNRVFRLNVAIRTLLCEKNRIEMGIGGGIIYDSTAEAEWQEALLKSRYATHLSPAFQVFETVRWLPNHGFTHLKAHLRRARISQDYFQRRFLFSEIKRAISRLLPMLESDPQYRKGADVKFVWNPAGNVESTATPPRTPAWGDRLKILLSADRTNSNDVFLSHKTTNREFYNRRLRSAREAGYDEIIFLNENGELTEGSISNLFLRKGNCWMTPAVECGLLAGVWRAQAIREYNAAERHLTMEDLWSADEIILGNSLRGAKSVKEIDREPEQKQGASNKNTIQAKQKNTGLPQRK